VGRHNHGLLHWQQRQQEGETMTCYHFKITGTINAETIDDAADILQIELDDLECRDILIEISNKDESLSQKKVD
jgi:hypothetical protein